MSALSLLKGMSAIASVKYFNNEQLERRNFATAIDDYQRIEYNCAPVPGRSRAAHLHIQR